MPKNTTNAAPASETIAESYVAVCAEVTPVVKDASNPYFNSEYATLAAIDAMLRPLLARHHLAVGGFARQLIDGTGAEWVTRLVHSSGAMMDFAIPFECADKKPQGYGSAITYFRRYGLAAAFGIVVVGDSCEDDGNRANGNSQKATAKPTASSDDF